MKRDSSSIDLPQSTTITDSLHAEREIDAYIELSTKI